MFRLETFYNKNSQEIDSKGSKQGLEKRIGSLESLGFQLKNLAPVPKNIFREIATIEKHESVKQHKQIMRLILSLSKCK